MIFKLWLKFPQPYLLPDSVCQVTHGSTGSYETLNTVQIPYQWLAVESSLSLFNPPPQSFIQ